MVFLVKAKTILSLVSLLATPLVASTEIVGIEFDPSNRTAMITVDSDRPFTLWRGNVLPLSGGNSFYTNWVELTQHPIGVGSKIHVFTDVNVSPKNPPIYQVKELTTKKNVVK